MRSLVVLVALLFGAVSEAWAQFMTNDDIEVLPATATGCSVVLNTSAEGTDGTGIKTNEDGSHTVYLTVTAGANYYITSQFIQVEKLLAPANANAPRRRTPGIADYLSVSGPNYVTETSGTGTFSFTVPKDYAGAYVTATFQDASNLVFIDNSTSLPDDPAMNGTYIVVEDIDNASTTLGKLNTKSATTPFSGTFYCEAKADGTFMTLKNVTKPLFAKTNGATIKNVMLTNVSITPTSYTGTNVGALVGEAQGTTRIYNCGILPSYIKRKYDEKEYKVVIDRFYDEDESTFTGDRVGSEATNSNVGSLVGKLSDNARVINCFSYATITKGTNVAGIVGHIGTTGITQDNVGTVPMVVNCMFYGDIIGGTTKYPVYGGAMILNENNNGVNPYNYFRKNANFDNSYTAIGSYNRSWPAEEKNLTRFEYYRSVLNSNRRLCTWWVSGTNGTASTDADVESVGIAKWVLDPGIAPYPILKKWGKYPSVINHDDEKVWYPGEVEKSGPDAQGKYTYTIKANSSKWVDRSSAKAYEGKDLGTLSVTINPGAHKASHVSTKSSVPFVMTDIDTLNFDYGYKKIQLPYYNDVFGNPAGTTWDRKYGGNYKEYVVTGWEITVSGGTSATNYNFADRKATNGRIFAQGGYYYVPEGVSSITITAHWGKAVYLANRNYSVDNVKLTPGGKGGYKSEMAFTPAGTILGTLNGIAAVTETNYQYTFHGHPVYNDWQNAIAAVATSTDNSNVYNQAIVLISNHQVKNGSNSVAGSNGNWHPFTIMSADFDFDNEPDYCMELQFRDDVDRPGIQPVRFDFLPVVELGLAVRHDNLAYAIGIFVPQGHFEITETALMHTTQFEWDTKKSGSTGQTRMDNNSPVILNGGEFEQLSVRYGNGNRTSYFLLGGNLWFHRFAPGFHPNKGTDNNPTIKLCPVNVIGGDFPEFYLSGLYRPDKAPYAEQGNPICYTSGGHFGIMAGSGYEKINGDVTFKIDHSVIGEFYGGGINGSKPIGGDIDVTINNSHVVKYCGGPKVGSMEYDDNGTTKYKTVTTRAEGTTFGVYYGSGNGGNSYYRELKNDGDQNIPTNNIISGWDGNYKLTSSDAGTFDPLVYYDDDINNENKGYHAEYEYEVFTQSNGVRSQITQRGFIKWIQFGKTATGIVSNTLKDCTIETNFFGGGNLGSVFGNINSTLTDTKVKGNVFGAGFSASVPTFRVHDKTKKGTTDYPYPSLDPSGTINDGKLGYKKETGDTSTKEYTEYKWVELPTEDEDGTPYTATQIAAMKANPTFKDGDQYYCYTWESLTNLGAVNGNVELTITGGEIGSLDNNDALIAGTGNVYGGGDSSAVTGNTTVTIKDGAEVYGNVFGGGNEGAVGGSTEVIIEE